MSHFGDLLSGTLSLIGFGTVVWLFCVCCIKARKGWQARQKLKQVRAKWEGMSIEQR